MLTAEELFNSVNEHNFNPMNDIIFKFIFGKEERKHITIDFLNALLAEDLGHTIENIKFEQTEAVPINEGGKLTRLDVACTLDTGEKVDVEVQVINQHNMMQRTLYYWAQMYVNGFRSGQNYKDLKPSITINIVHFNLFEDEDPHSVWSVCNLKTGKRMSKDLTLHFLEVPKYASISHKSIKDMNPMERWLSYFANKLNDKGKEELIMSEAAIRDAIDAARIFFKDPAEKMQYVNREMAISDYNTNIIAAKEEGEDKVLDLVEKLLADGRIDEIRQVKNDKKLREKLYKEYGIK